MKINQTSPQTLRELQTISDTKLLHVIDDMLEGVSDF